MVVRKLSILMYLIFLRLVILIWIRLSWVWNFKVIIGVYS